MGLPTVSTSDPLPRFLQENLSPPESGGLTSSLPREKGWLATHLYRYQGFWHPSNFLSAVLSCQSHFRSLPSDVLLATTPKSGTTWLKALAFSILNRSHHPIPPHGSTAGHPHPLLSASPHELVPFLEYRLYFDSPAPDLSLFRPPRIFATHLPFVSLPESVKGGSGGGGGRCKVVYLCRNPRDTFVSMWHFTNSLKSQDMAANQMEEVFDQFCRGVSLSGPFWEHVLGYWRESQERAEEVLFLKYEEMKERPGVHLRRIAAFLGCPFSGEEEGRGVVEDVARLCSFENLSGLEVNTSGKLPSGEENRSFFRRGVVGDWKNHLTPAMVHRLDRITEEKLAGTGLTL